MEKNRNMGGLVVGAILIAIGILALLGNFFTTMNWDNLWPLAIIGIGVLFFIGMVLGGKGVGGLAIPGSILITVGLILLFMNNTGRWEAWAYSWALIIFGIGVGEWISGMWSDQPEQRKRGQNTMRSGLILFLTFGVIMEFIFSVTGVSQESNLLLWAILLVILGVVLLVTRILRLGKPGQERVDLFWPILLIGIGAIATLAYLGWIPTDNLWALLNLWPLLLIVAGLGIIFRNRSPWLGAVMGVVVVGVMLVVAYAGGQLGMQTYRLWPFEDISINFGDDFGERINGSGNVISESRTVSGFDRVRMEIPGNLDIQSGASESLTVSGDDNIMPLLVTEVRGNVLVIRFKPNTNVRPSKPVQLKLIADNLQGLDVSSSGDVKIAPFTTGDFDLLLTSSGAIVLEDIQADRIEADLTSSGDITVDGQAEQLDLQLSSSGSFDGKDLEAQKADVSLTSSGSAIIWVVDDLNARITSSGDVIYYGDPTVRQNLSSSGKLIARGEK